MKRYLIISILLSISIIAHSTIINVDNNANRPNGYIKNLQNAISTASAGDSIYIYPSNVTYGNITITKKLHLFGFGYDGTTGTNSKIGQLIFDTTSTPSSNPSGSTIQGLYFSTSIYCSKQNISNIIISGNHVDEVSMQPNCSNWIITNNYIYDYISLNNNVSIIVSNNVFRSHTYGIYTSNSSSVVISNNLFIYWGYFYNVFNATVNNNIFICNTASLVTNKMSNNSFNNNISYCVNSSQTYTLPPSGNTGSGNKSNQNPSFINGTISSTYDISKDYHLQAASTGKNAGTDGTDIGQYGGTNPFIWGGAFTIPKVSQITISNPIINQGTTININVKAKSADL